MILELLSAIFLTTQTANAAAATATQAAKPTALPIAIKSSEASFVASAGAGTVNIEGKGAKLKGAPMFGDGKLSGTFELPISEFTTDMAKRDDHMKKLMLVDKYPTAKFELEPVVAKGDQTCVGALTLKGVTSKPKSCKISFEGNHAKVTMEVSLTDFSIERASFLGVKVDDKVVAKIDFDMQI